MKKYIGIIVLLALIGLGLFEAIGNGSLGGDIFAEDDAVGLDVGNTAPDFQLTTLSGQTVSLSDYRGKKVLVNFWATWCPPCRAEMPDMEKFYKEHDEEIEILAVNATMSEKNEQNIQRFVDDFSLSFPVLLDVDNNVNQTYQIVSIPTSYFIDSDGKVSTKFTGAMSYDYMVKEMKKMK